MEKVQNFNEFSKLLVLYTVFSEQYQEVQVEPEGIAG
jgi:hypothetical protein